MNITMIFSMGRPTPLLSLVGHHAIGIFELRGRVELLSPLMSLRARAFCRVRFYLRLIMIEHVQTNKNR